MRFLVLFTMIFFLMVLAFGAYAATTGKAEMSQTELLFSFLGGFGGSLIAGKGMKSVPINWGTGQKGNNLIPATNPVLIGTSAYMMTNDAKATGLAVLGSLVAWGAHQLGKKIAK